MDRRCAAVESDRRQTRKPYFNLGGRFKGHPKGKEKNPRASVRLLCGQMVLFSNDWFKSALEIGLKNVPFFGPQLLKDSQRMLDL